MTVLILAVVALGVCLLLVPLGIPGIWLMVGILAVGALYGEVGAAVLLATLVLAGAAELVEFLLVKRYSERYGGTRLAFWGALAGGLIGVLVGVPVPLVGPLIAGIAGTFAGAALATLWQLGDAAHAARVGWGVVIARVLAVGVKMAAGVGILVIGATSLLAR